MRRYFIFVPCLLFTMCFFYSTLYAQALPFERISGGNAVFSTIAGGKISGQTLPKSLPRLVSDHREYCDRLFGEGKGVSVPYSRAGVSPDVLPKITRPDRAPLGSSANISVIDTAICLRTTDTVRFVYQYDASARMTTELTQALIEGNWVNSDRISNTFDADGNWLSDLHETWRVGPLVRSYRYTRTYDGHGNQLSEMADQMLNEEWVSVFRIGYTYDSNDNLLSSLQEYLTDGLWVNSTWHVYTYDSRGNTLSGAVNDWMNGHWVRNHFDLATYDSNGHVLTELLRYWSNGELQDSTASANVYDANGNLITEMYDYWWSGVAQHMRGEMTYDPQGNMLSHLYQFSANGLWENYSRLIYSYDSRNNRLSRLEELWLDGAWVNANLSTWEYDQVSNLKAKTEQQWSEGKWENHTAAGYDYDLNNNLVKCVSHTWADSAWVIGDVEVRQTVGDEFLIPFLGHDLTFIRHTIVTGVSADPGSLPASFALQQNYPNPFNPSTVIRYNLPVESHVRITIANVLGQEIRMLADAVQQVGEKSVTFDAKGLPSGMYFYRLDATSASDPTNHFTQTRRMMMVK